MEKFTTITGADGVEQPATKPPKEKPEPVIETGGKLSNRQIADTLGVSHPTVRAVRKVLEKSGDVEKFTTSTDAMGRQQPTTKPPKEKPEPVVEPVTPEPERPPLTMVVEDVEEPKPMEMVTQSEIRAFS